MGIFRKKNEWVISGGRIIQAENARKRKKDAPDRGICMSLFVPDHSYGHILTQMAGRMAPVTSDTTGPVSSRTPILLTELAQFVACPGLRSHHQAQFLSAVP